MNKAQHEKFWDTRDQQVWFLRMVNQHRRDCNKQIRKATRQNALRWDKTRKSRP